jgi:hypothetical protein
LDEKKIAEASFRNEADDVNFNLVGEKVFSRDVVFVRATGVSIAAASGLDDCGQNSIATRNLPPP